MNPPPIKVLLVEDSPSDADLIQEYLGQFEFEQFEITVVDRLEAAVARVRQAPFDVVLLDLSLPDSTGCDTFLRMQQAAPQVPLVVLTGVGGELRGLEAVRRGVQDYLTKGQADSRQIARSIRYAIERHRAEMALRDAHDKLERMVEVRTTDLQHANQMLRMISECNVALVHKTNEQELTQTICSIITQLGGYVMAWVGFADNDRARTVRAIASVGFEQGYLDRARITWANNPFGRGPTGTAIRTGKISLGHDFLSQPELAPWRELALERGYRSSVALPLRASGRTFGALTIYSDRPNAFDAGQVSLLAELADDLAFGITSLCAQSEINQARLELRQKTIQLRALTTELIRAEQRERRRIAQVLHDDLQQFLVGARYSLESLRGYSPDRVFQETIQHIDGLFDKCFATSRSLTLELSPPILYEAGLASALNWLGRWFQQTHGLAVRVTGRDLNSAETEEVRLMLFSAARELLFNIVKHAKVKRAELSLSQPTAQQVKVMVSDKGVGFDPEKLRFREGTSSGFGLFSLRERLESLGGRMLVESAPGRGSRFTLFAPLRRELAQAATASAIAPPAEPAAEATSILELCLKGFRHFPAPPSGQPSP